MASTQKVKLVVLDDEDVTVVEDEIDGSVNGDQIFKEMNTRCAFGLWERADALVDKEKFAVSNSSNTWQDQTYAKEDLQRIIGILPTIGAPCRFTVQVRKKGEYETNSDAPGGPVAPKNPGLRPRQGPDDDGFETPAGLGVSLARMRGMLSRL